MLYKGIKFNRAYHLHYRTVTPELDAGIVSNPEKHSQYIVPISMLECVRPANIDEEGSCFTIRGKYYENYVFDGELASKAPCISRKLSYSRTNMAYGTPRRSNATREFWMRLSDDPEPAQQSPDEACDVYRPEGLFSLPYHWTMPIYLVKNGQVFTATSRIRKNPAWPSREMGHWEMSEFSDALRERASVDDGVTSDKIKNVTDNDLAGLPASMIRLFLIDSVARSINALGDEYYSDVLWDVVQRCSDHLLGIIGDHALMKELDSMKDVEGFASSDPGVVAHAFAAMATKILCTTTLLKDPIDLIRMSWWVLNHTGRVWAERGPFFRWQLHRLAQLCKDYSVIDRIKATGR